MWHARVALIWPGVSCDLVLISCYYHLVCNRCFISWYYRLVCNPGLISWYRPTSWDLRKVVNNHYRNFPNFPQVKGWVSGNSPDKGWEGAGKRVEKEPGKGLRRSWERVEKELGRWFTRSSSSSKVRNCPIDSFNMLSIGCGCSVIVYFIAVTTVLRANAFTDLMYSWIMG